MAAPRRRLLLHATLQLLLLAAAAAASSAANRTTRVLAYGDSLTAGFWRGGSRFHPYSTRLSALLGGCVVDHIGLSGWTAQEMRQSLGTGQPGSDGVRRAWVPLDAALSAAAAEGAPYSHVVVLAGTNDLGRVAQGHAGRTPADVVADVRALHEAAHAAGVPVTVAVSVPQPAFEGGRPPFVAVRAEINAGIRAYAAAADGSHAVLLADADAALPNLNATEEVRQRRWEPDGLHFTPAGYNELGALVAATLTAAGATPCGAPAGRALEATTAAP
jgi:lysophospholipase L1-like esterase